MIIRNAQRAKTDLLQSKTVGEVIDACLENVFAKRGGYRLMSGNSDNGGAGYVNNDHRGNRWDNRGFRLSVAQLFYKRLSPATDHFSDFNQVGGKRKISCFFKQFFFYQYAQ